MVGSFGGGREGAQRGCPRGHTARGRIARLAAAAGLLAAIGCLSACTAVYPEVATRTGKVAAGQPLDPGPPGDLMWIRFLGAHVPPVTRGGQSWGTFGTTPDAYAKLFLNGKEILRTPAQSGTLDPTWPDGPRGNFHVGPEDRMRVELWNANPLNDHPIGVLDLGHASGGADGRVHVTLEGGAEVILALEPAHAIYGLGLWFELRTSSAYITRLLAESPADRAGLDKGDEVLRIGSRDVKTMSADEVRSAFNAISSAGLPVSLRRKDGTTAEVVLAEGPIYATYDEYGPLD